MDHSEENQSDLARALSNETSARLLRFFQQGTLSDCTFQFGSGVLKAHKLILACSSPVFEQMFYGSMPSDAIRVDDIPIEDFQQVLDYIYTGSIIFYSIQHAWDFFYVAQKYMLNDLSTICREYILKNLTLSTLVLSYEYADLYNDKLIREKCSSDMRDNVYAIFNNSEYHMKASTLRDLMRIPLSIVNADIIYKIIEWAMDECQSTESEAVVETLKTTDVIPFIDKRSIADNDCDYCLQKIVDCACVNENIRRVLNYLAGEDIVWDEYSGRLYVHDFRPVPPSIKIREEFKIARRIDLAADRDFISILSVDTKSVVSGVQLSTEMQPINVTNDSYRGRITIKFFDEFSKQPLATPTIVSGEFSYDSYDYVPLRFPVVLEPHNYYDIRISYKNCDTHLKSSLVCRYRSPEIVHRSFAKMSFYDMLGTVIKGVAFYPV